MGFIIEPDGAALHDRCLGFRVTHVNNVAEISFPIISFATSFGTFITSHVGRPEGRGVIAIRT